MWQIKPLTYDICIPPLKSNLYEMNDEEAQACFDWYMSVLPERIKYVSETAAHKLGCSVETFDLTPESLIPLWEWFLSVAEKEPASIQHEVIRSDYQLSLQTEYILRDIGMYLGEAFVKNHSSLHWGIKKNQKTLSFIIIRLFRVLLSTIRQQTNRFIPFLSQSTWQEYRGCDF